MKKQGIYTVIATIAIQLAVGIAYIWSVFQTGVANSIFGGDNAAASLTFSLMLAAMSIGSVLGGNLTAKISSRLVVFFGGVIISAGFFLASFATSNYPWILWVSYGVMGGIGMGFIYSTTIACTQKWFPHKKGLITGIVVSALGFGGVVFTPLAEALIRYFGGEGYGEPGTFMVLSAIVLVVCVIGCIFIKNPPEKNAVSETTVSAAGVKAAKEYSPKEMLRTLKFYLIIVSLMLACMGGLMMIGFAKPIAVARGLEATATAGVLAITLFNSAGRLIWGMVSDKLGRVNTIIILLTGTAGLSLMVNAVSGYWIYVLIAMIGFFYGGFLSCFPSLTADIFGVKHMAPNYGIVLIGFGAGAIISSQIAGYYKNLAAQDINLMFPAFVISSCCAVAGIAMMLCLKTATKRAAVSDNCLPTQRKLEEHV